MDLPAHDAVASASGDAILIAEGSLEGELIAAALRVRGFAVSEVPPHLLGARAVTDGPRAVLLDVDHPGALDAVEGMRDLAYAPPIELFCLGDPARAVELGLPSGAGRFFARPVDVASVVSAMTRELGERAASRRGPRSKREGSDAPGPSSDTAHALDPLDVASIFPAPDEGVGSSRALPVALSRELAQTLEDAEGRVAAREQPPSARLEVADDDLVLSEDVLAVLDEPLDASDDEVMGTSAGIGRDHRSATTGVRGNASSPGVSFDALGLDPPSDPGAYRTGTGPLSGGHFGGHAFPGPDSSGPMTEARLGEMPPRVPAAASSAGGREPMVDTGRPASVPTDATRGPTSPFTFAGASPSTPRGASLEFDGTDPGRGSTTRVTDPGRGPILSAPIAPIALEAPRMPAILAKSEAVPRGASPLSSGRGSLLGGVTEPGRNVVFSAVAEMPRIPALTGFADPWRTHGSMTEPGRALGPITEPPRAAPSVSPPRPATADDAGRRPAVPADVANPARPIPPVSPAPIWSAPQAGPPPLPPPRVPQPRVTPPPPPEPLLPAVLGEGDAARSLARAIASRASGSLALGRDETIRRIVLHEGDIVTAGSSAADETLVAFLTARGDLERDAAAQLAGKLAPFGRHAGAALIAHDHLGQDDLWPVLRAHAEWIIGRALAESAGTCELEAEPPGRYKLEPGVFGGATGAEVFVEAVRRVVPPEVALARLGGPEARLVDGPSRQLLAECALRREDDARVRSAAGCTVAEVLDGGDPELADSLYALVTLGVLDALAPARPSKPEPGGPGEALDEEALRRRVRARLALVEDADYFTLLGVPRTATAYELRRAYLDLRRSFEPSRVLTAATADLADDVRLVLEVLDEAYEILREPRRRERYRKAIEAGPP